MQETTSYNLAVNAIKARAVFGGDSLDLLHGKCAADVVAIVLDNKRNIVDLACRQLGLALSALVRLLDRTYDLFPVKYGLRAVSLDDFHAFSSLSLKFTIFHI